MVTFLGWLGIALSSAGLMFGAWQYHALGTREITLGRVVELIPERGQKGGTTYRTIAIYQDRTGQTHTYRSSFTASPAPYKVGELIRICFSKDAPSAGSLAGFGARFGTPWALAGMGLLLLWMAFGFTSGRRWIEGIFPVTLQPSAEITGKSRQ